MEDTKIGQSDWQIFIGALDEGEHDAMSRTVHGFESILLMLITNPEDILSVFEVMPRNLPQLGVVYGWSEYLVVASDFVLGTHELL
jgi:hypothetical protein